MASGAHGCWWWQTGSPPPLHGINISTHTNCKKLHCPPSTQPGVLCFEHIDQKCELRITEVLQTRPAVLRPLSCSILRCGTSPFATMMHNVTLLAIKDRKRKKVILYKTGFVVCSRGPALALERQKRSGNDLASCMCCCGCGHSLPCGICCGNQLSSCTYSSNSLPNCIFCRQSFPWA